MSLLTAADLAYMQATQEQAMPGTVYILGMGTATNGMGGYSETWGTVGTVTGRVYPMVRRGQPEVMAAGQMVSETSWFATLPVGTSVTAKNRIEYNGRTWEVVRVNNSEMWQTAVRCELTAHNEERRV